MSNSTTLEQPAPAKPLALRAIASALTNHLQACPDNDLHWVSVIGEDSVCPTPTRAWNQELRDSLLHVSVSDGWSEGTLLHVYAQRNRYQPELLNPLFRIKLLCGHRRAFVAAGQVWEFLQSPAFAELTA